MHFNFYGNTCHRGCILITIQARRYQILDTDAESVLLKNIERITRMKCNEVSKLPKLQLHLLFLVTVD